VTERDTGPDPLGDLQRWLMRTGARSVTKDITGQMRRALGQDRPKADVWDTATSRPVEDEAPECAWCPVCRAARRLRESRQASGTSGFGSQLAGAGDALASVVQEAYSAFESAMKAGPASHGPASHGPARTGAADRWEDATRGPDDRP
jgi:hypothetical protein